MTDLLPDPLDQEAQIAAALAEYFASTNQPEFERMKLWIVVVDLIAARTPKRVREVELAMGLDIPEAGV